MKKNGSKNAKESVPKKTDEEDVEHALLRVLRADLDDLLRVLDARLLDALELDVRLDELDRAVGAGRHGLRRRAREPVDHAPPAMRPSRNGRVEERELVEVRPSACPW
jgi:hypothetical protein